MSSRITRSAARRAPATAAAAVPARATPDSGSGSPKAPKRRKVTNTAAASSASAGTPRPANKAPPRPHDPEQAAQVETALTTPLPEPSGLPRIGGHPSTAERILEVEKTMSDALAKLSFKKPVTHVYNPLEYAWDAHAWYVRRYAKREVRMLLVGMNPGPWGMAQTGVPFGEVEAVRDFLQMPPATPIGKPARENSARLVEGLSCARSEVSGKRLWREWAARAVSVSTETATGGGGGGGSTGVGADAGADEFFRSFFVHNYCPLMMMEGSGRNRTPVQLPAAERDAIHDACDDALADIAKALRPKAIVGVGGYATQRVKNALKTEVKKGLVVATVLHPSPASPAANRGWVQQAVPQITEIERLAKASEHQWD